jgi:tetratricopeptide (TPR) repeat protein
MQRRNGVYPAAGKVNWKKSYNAILEKFPDSAYACRTIVYLLEDDFSQSDPEISAGAFDKLESFIKKFAGDSRNLVPVHLFADFEYIARRVDYKSAIRHLKAAYDLGIISPKVAEETLFRLGRMSQIKLKNSQSAEKYYTIFLEKFPHSRYTPLVKRYLSEL